MFGIIEVTGDICLLFAFKTVDQTGGWVYLMSRIECLGSISELLGALAKLHDQGVPINLFCAYVVTARINLFFLALLVLCKVRKYFSVFLGEKTTKKIKQKNPQPNKNPTLSCTLAVLNHVCCFNCLCQTTFSLLCFRTVSFSLKTGFLLSEKSTESSWLVFCKWMQIFQSSVI